MSNAKISVGITAYKNSKYIFEALNSLINQSVDSWEGVFVLDKGADKDTQKIFDSFNHPKFLKHKCKRKPRSPLLSFKGQLKWPYLKSTT